MLINAENIEKYFGDRLIFKFPSFKAYKGDRIGIVGANGSGKSTLLRVLAGIISPDAGKVYTRCVIGYSAQIGTENTSKKTNGINKLGKQALNQSAIHEQEHNAQTIDADGLYSSVFGATPNPLSGGEIMRKKLASAFSNQPDILMLDEPTANLDLDGIAVLNAMLDGIETLILISHDRSLLNTHCNKIIEIKNGKLTEFSGNYSDYEQVSKETAKHQASLYEDYISEKKRLEQSMKNTKSRSASIKKTPSRMGNSEARLHKRSSTEIQAKLNRTANSIKSRLERLETAERPIEIKPIKLDFSLTDPPKNKVLFSASGLCFSYDETVLLEDADLIVQNGERTAITGANGSGKSTLLKLINECPDLIYRVPKAKIGVLAQDFSTLKENMTILDNVLDTTVQTRTVCQNVLANLGFRGDETQKKPSVLSGGELIKASLAKLIVSDCNILLLDEPTNYLDIESITQLQSALLTYEGTLIFVSHDRSFIDAIATSILKIKDKRIIKLL